jgi:RNA polymerase sigma factor (sigma-70 family)
VVEDDFDEIHQAFRGGLAAFGGLLQRVRPYLLRIANTELGADDRQLIGGVTNVVDDVIAKAFLHCATFRGQTPGELKQWMKAILRSTLSDELREAKRLHQSIRERAVTSQGPTLSEELLLEQGSRDAEQVSASQRAAEIHGVLLQALQGLSHEEIIVFLLHKPPGRKATFDQIAALLDISERTARERYKNVEEKLKNDQPLRDLARGGPQSHPM